MKNYIIPDAVLGKILNYLATKPYHEVAQIIEQIQREARLVPVNEKADGGEETPKEKG